MLKLVTCSDPNEAARNDVNLWNSGKNVKEQSNTLQLRDGLAEA